MMKLLPFLLLLLSFNATAATPETCLEIVRGYWLAYSINGVEPVEQSDRAYEQCEFDNAMLWKIQDDEHVQSMISALQEQGVII